MNFKSDNTAPVHPSVMAAIVEANNGFMGAYGTDPITAEARLCFNQIFEKEVASLFVGTGTAANCLALQALCPPYGAVFCHPGAHINTDETNAPELFGHGLKLIGIPGKEGKISLSYLVAEIERLKSMRPHAAMPAMISITQLTEAGTIYSVEEIKEIAAIAKHYGLKLHMDGARFANAVAHLKLSPAELTWQLGVDVLSLGATKNGAMAAEAVIFFNPNDAKVCDYHQKRNAQLFSKMRYFSCQFKPWFKNNLWLELAQQANTTALNLATTLIAYPKITLIHPVNGNEVFVTMPGETAAYLRQHNVGFYDWGAPEDNHYRFVTSYCTPQSEVDNLAALLRRKSQ